MNERLARRTESALQRHADHALNRAHAAQDRASILADLTAAKLDHPIPTPMQPQTAQKTAPGRVA